MAKIAVIVGSVRSDRQGIKVAGWIEKNLVNRNHVVFFIDPLELKLPLLDRMYKEMAHPSDRLQFLRNQIKEADGYLPITPEYNRSTSSAMKNTRLFFRGVLFQTIRNCFILPRSFWGDQCNSTASTCIC